MPTHGWLVTDPSMSPENDHPAARRSAPGPTMDIQILRDLFASALEAARPSASMPSCRSGRATARAAGAADRIGSAGQLQEWLEDWDMEAPEIASPARLAPLRPLSQPRRSRPRHAGTRCRVHSVARDPRRQGHRLGDRLAHQPVGPAARRRSCLRHPPVPARRPSAPIPTCSTRIRRSRSTATSAAPRPSPRCWCKARGRDPAAARAARGVAGGPSHRPARARRRRGRSGVEGRQARERDRSFAARTAAACASRQHAAHLPDLRAVRTLTLAGDDMRPDPRR